jgi:hypothetical protein
MRSFPDNRWKTQRAMEVDERPPLSPQMMEVGAALGHNGNYAAQKRRRPVKHVSFAEEALLYRSNRTREDMQRLWYSSEELATLKQERREIIRILKKVDFDLKRIDQEKVCLRGYEPYFSVAMNKATKYARALVSSVVLVEQSRQRMMGIFDVDSMRERSSQASQWARDNGIALGSIDAALNPLRAECLGRPNDPSLSDLTYSRVSLVDDNTVRQLESTLAMVKATLRECTC